MSTTYVWGTDDPAFRPTGAEGTADHVTAPYRFIRLEGVGHWISEHAPDDLTAAILDQVHHGA